jgi:D-inositol-3-phosphate glycosyltransferase
MGGFEGFSRIGYWKEPLATRFGSNLGLLARAAKGKAVVHINRANPYTASLALAARSSIQRLVVDMEDWDGIGGYTSYARRYGLAGIVLTISEGTFPRTAQAVVVVSSLLSSRMRTMGVPTSRISVIPNGYDHELFRPEISGKEAKAAFRLDGYPLLIYASNFWPFEREIHKSLLECFLEVVRKEPSARLVVVGRGSAMLSAIVKGLGLERNVTFAGFVPRADLPGLVAAADIAVHMISDHPFHLASSPMIIPEYMGMRKPIVAPRIGELARMLGGGAGYLVERGDRDGMAAAILELSKDDSLREAMGRTAEGRARTTYSYEVLAKTLDAVYRSVSG